MPVSIRLSRVGTKHKPFYRMVVLDSRKKRDGACLENIGTIDGLKGEFVIFKPERFDAWVAQGAQPSETAKKLYRQYKKKIAAKTVAPITVTEVKKKAPKKSEESVESKAE
jgi:small subunit ribosomal protein S16